MGYEVRKAETNGEIAAIENMQFDIDVVREEFRFDPKEFFRWVIAMRQQIGDKIVVFYVIDTSKKKPVGVLVAADFRVNPICDFGTAMFYYSKAPNNFNDEMIAMGIEHMKRLGVTEIRIETKNPRLYTRYGFKKTQHVVMTKGL
ncbi:MAG: hypothetical protein ABIH23_31750 [bacterium]